MLYRSVHVHVHCIFYSNQQLKKLRREIKNRMKDSVKNGNTISEVVSTYMYTYLRCTVYVCVFITKPAVTVNIRVHVVPYCINMVLECGSV